jgi:Flp pilus assembly protein CpaB
MVGAALDAPARPAARAPRRAIHTRLSAGHVVMLLAGLLGALCTLAALRAADHRVEVLVARHDLAAGTTITRDDLRAVRVTADAAVMRSLVRAERAGDLLGRVVTARVAAGRFVATDDVRSASAGAARRSMSFPVDRARALDGALVAGDRVDVVAVDPRRAAARYVATNAEVLRVDGSASRGALGGSDAVIVTLAVDPDVALGIATAVHGNDLTLVRATGAAPIAVADGEAGR